MKKRIFSVLLALVLVLSVLAACAGPQGPAGPEGPPGPGLATFVVAASNSIDRESADYICDGEDDQVEINTAINDLPAGGGSVYLMEGTFILGGNITISGSNVCLVGSGAATVLQIKDGKNADMNVVYASGQENLLVKDLRIDGNRTNQTAGTMYGIYFTGVKNSKIVDCWVENLISNGIWLWDSSNNNIVTGNTCQGNSVNGIYLEASSNNTVTGNTCGGNSQFGIFLNASSNNTVTGNACGENGSHGILLSDSSNNSVTGNTCQGNIFGIFLGYSDNNTVSSNICDGNSYYGICLYNSRHNVVSSNIVEGNGQYGIYLYCLSHHNIVSVNMVISNSQIADNTYDGIFISDDCDYNNIGGNTVRRGPPESTKKQRYGIRIDTTDCEYNLVINNDLYHAGATADFSNAGTGTIYHNNRTSDGWVP